MVNRSILAIRVGQIIFSFLGRVRWRRGGSDDPMPEIALSRPTLVSSAPAHPSAGLSYGASSPILSRAVKDRPSSPVILSRLSEVGLIRPPASTIQLMLPTNTSSLAKEAHPMSWSRVLVLDLAATRKCHRQVRRATSEKQKRLPSTSTKVVR